MNRLDEAIHKNGTPLLGMSINRYDPIFVEILASLGFHILWIEMEHGLLTFAEACDLCRIASGLGLLTMIRIPDSRRENVLKAAECGPDIIDLPMANSPEVLEELVRHARYSPQGNRGFFGSSRAVRYGLGNALPEERRRINNQLCLMGQIETREAVDRAEELCSVGGIDAVFLGLGDLSDSLGVVGQTDHPSVRQAAERSLSIAKSKGKRVAVADGPANAAIWTRKGADILFCASDVACLKLGMQTILREIRDGLATVDQTGRG
ncbi:MAG: HpcH/HpaI aldolase family protein [bacterium]